MDKNFIKCQLCFDIYKHNIEEKKPRNLPCGHTFCSDCIDKLYKDDNKNHLECPNDRRVFVIEKSRKLPISFSLLNIAENFCSSAGCENQLNTVSLYCYHCKQKICDHCRETHFAAYKKILVERLASLNVRLTSYQANASEIKNLLRIETEFTKNYIQKTVPKMLGDEIEAIKKEIDDFLHKILGFSEKIEKEALIFTEYAATQDELCKKIESIVFDTSHPFEVI